MALISVAYCDESEHHLAPPIYVVSGLLARGPDWYELGRLWRIALREEKLDAHGFHMAPCESGHKPPYDMISHAQRMRLQRRFIGIIAKTPVWGFATAVELERIKQPDIHVPRKAALGPYHKPYYQCFQHTVVWIGEQLERGGFPKAECVAFIFDQQQEYQGNAKDLYDEMRQSEDIPYRHRLGSLTFESRMNHCQLQAADVWAYESQRHIREVKLGGQKPRWQFEQLAGHHGGRTNYRIQVLDKHGAESMAKEQGWIP